MSLLAQRSCHRISTTELDPPCRAIFASPHTFLTLITQPCAHDLQSGDESERYDDTVSALDVSVNIRSDGFVALVATPPDEVVQSAVDSGVSRISFAREKMSSGELYYWCFNATPSSSDDATVDEDAFSDRGP